MNAKVKEQMLALTQILLEDVDMEIEQTTDPDTHDRMEATRITVEELIRKVEEA